MAAQLLTALYRCGLPAEALLHYDAVRKRLAEDLGVDPAPELLALHQRLSASHPGPRTPVPAPISAGSTQSAPQAQTASRFSNQWLA
ncbi:BTAD domain-containing putative transcriptional regulator [Streptomyces sp. uw30]|uniref:AfsR/SARP family transcriptional regulator n=1 Tax=Streptomyces sp. uw30 TaxID=1828179 RepID=UPI0021C848EA